jgi:PAS domain S-box-containing protein
VLRDLPPRARAYIIAVIVLGAAALILLLPRATFTPVLPLLFLIALSALTSAFKVSLPIASGSNMSVSYIVDIAALILRGPHATMLVGAAGGWSQTVLNATSPNRLHRTLFNMAVLVLTVQTAGQVYARLGGSAQPDFIDNALPLAGMALTYFFLNTFAVAVAVAWSTNQSAWTIWKTEFASTGANYALGAAAAAVVIAVIETSGYWLALLFIAAPLYLTYKMYRAGVETRARQGAILEAAQDAIITMDQQLAIREFNPAAERMFGYSRRDVLGRRVDLLLPPSDRGQQLDAFTQYQITGGGPLARPRLELTALKADGTEFPVELSVSRVGADSRAMVTGFIRDITERRVLEEQLRQSQKLEAIGRLAGGVAHDFNNILMSIMGASDLLLVQVDKSDPARGEALEIRHAVERGAALTRQLLAFSKRQATRPRELPLADIVRGMDSMLRRLIGPEIDFEIGRDPRSPIVVADPGQIEQVIMNLAINARDAMPNGGRLRIRVDEIELGGLSAIAITEGHAGRYARVSVTDTGTGMDAQTQAKLFEPFFTTKDQGKGTGLGLSIVYGIVKQSGGYVSVASEVGEGTTFYIYLPLVAASTPSAVTV